MVVVAVDETGAMTRALGGEALRSGAVALLVTADPRGAVARVGGVQLRRGSPVAATGAPGHLALVPVVARPGPLVLEHASAPDVLARIELVAL
jgi:hypothetical protein